LRDDGLAKHADRRNGNLSVRTDPDMDQRCDCMTTAGRLAPMLMPGEPILWSGRAYPLRCLGLGQIVLALIGLGLVTFGIIVLWDFVQLRGTAANSVFRDVLSSPQQAQVRGVLAIVIGAIFMFGLFATVWRATGTTYHLSQSQAFVLSRYVFGQTAVAGRIQRQGQVATAQGFLGAAVVIPTGAGEDQDGIMVFDGLRATDLAAVMAILGNLQSRDGSEAHAI
jgi:hypothetical protein